MRTFTSIFLLSFLLTKAFATSSSECRQSFSFLQSESVSLSQKVSQELAPKGFLSRIKGFFNQKNETAKLQTVKPLSPKDLNRLITEGAILSRGQELEFSFHLRKTFGSQLDQQLGLKEVLDIMEKHPGRLNKLPVREQDIVFVAKQKTPPESLAPFIQSFRGRANKVKGFFQISANWGLWAKLLSFESSGLSKQQRREAFFEYLNSSPLGQSIEKFVKDLSFNVTNSQTASSQQTVKQFIENPLTPYTEKTIVLYKVLDHFRAHFIKQGREDISEKLSLLMVEVIHATGFNNPVWFEQLKSKDPLVVMEAVRNILSERDLVAMELGFTDTHYKGLKSSLLDAFTSPQVNSVKKDVIENQVANILEDISHQPELSRLLKTFRLRALTVQESPFRGCLGRDCSTSTYFKTALDPAYLYFTLTDSDFISYGHITVVLGTAKNQKGEFVKTAFVDKIQNIPNYRIIPMLEGIKKSLNEQGYTLALPVDVGGVNGLSNLPLTSNFVKNKILPDLKNTFNNFKIQTSPFLFSKAGYSRADFNLSLLEFESPKDQRDFEIHPLKIPQLKKIDESFKIEDWFFNAIKSKNEKDQLLLIASLPDLLKFELLSFKQALNYLQSKIEDKNLSFELRKKAMFALIQVELLKDNFTRFNRSWFSINPEKYVKRLQFIESLLLQFSKTELTSLIGEMSNWEKSSTKYKKDFVVFLSMFFYPEYFLNVLNSSVPSLFEFVANMNYKDKSDFSDHTPLHRMIIEETQQTVQILIDRGADGNIKDSSGQTPLHWAIIKDRQQIAQILIDRGADFKIEDNKGKTPLDYATEKGWVLVNHATGREHKQILPVLVNQADSHNRSDIDRIAINHAVEREDIQKVKLLLEGGADPNSKTSSLADRWTVLNLAIFRGYKEIVWLLIKAGADLHNKDYYGQTILNFAVGRGNKDIVELLLKGGADLHNRDFKNKTVLYTAIYERDKDMVELLLKQGADPDNIGHFLDQSALHQVILYLNGDKEIFQILLEAGADFNLKDIYNKTPLDYAIQKGYEEIAQLLRSYGAKE